MGNLFLSFAIAIGGAVGLVSMSKVFDLDTYTNRIFPLIPILYALIYEVLERKKTGTAKSIPPSEAKEEMKAGARTLFRNITAGRIIIDVAVSFGIKFGLEIGLAALFLVVTGQRFAAVYGAYDLETVGRFLRGDHPWLAGHQGTYILALVALLTSLGTGLWIGNTTKGNAILEGVMAGAAVTFVMTMTNMLALYRELEQITLRLADSLGYAMRAGFLVVIGLQVLLYGLWSGFAQQSKQERAERAAEKKARRRAKK